MRRIILLTMIGLLLTACSGDGTKPHRIGDGRDDLKKSPCACGPLVPQPNDQSKPRDV